MPGKREGFQRLVEKLLKYIEENDVDQISVYDAAMILGISPNYARAILKAIAEKYNYIYHWGVLYVRRSEG